ncbi:MAG: hypothetical protein WD844_04030 [Thermoleophilaceae bacterium]
MDASSLIYLAKADGFADAAECVARLSAPPAVWAEVVDAGRHIGAPEVGRIVAAHEAGFLARADMAGGLGARAAALAAEHRLGRGESEVLAAALPDQPVVVDEARATRIARSLGLVPISTLRLPVLGVRRGTLDPTRARALLRRLAAVTGARADAVFAIEEQLRES